MSKNTITTLAWTLLLMLTGLRLQAQTQPVSGNVLFQPPYSVYFNEFTDPAKPRINLTLLQNDLQEPNLDVKLRLTIEGNGMRLTTTPTSSFDPIGLVPGMNLITPDQLEPYFNLNRLDVAGYNKQQLIQSGKLPEGFYTFCFEVLAYNRNVVVSAPMCTGATLRLNNPPIPVAPAMNATVSAAGSQNIPFNWIANHDPSLAAQYELTLVEVPQNMNINDAINGAQTPLLDAHVVTTNAFTYGPGEVQLTAGKKYAWRVQVVDPAGNATFENDGLSPVMGFNYGFNTGGNIPLSLPQSAATVTSLANINLIWNGPDNTVPNQPIEYQVRAIAMNSGESAIQAMQRTSYVVDEMLPPTTTHFGSNYSIPTELEPSTDYAWQVQAFTDGILVASSEVRQFRTPPVVDEFFGANGQVACNFVEITSFTKIDADQYTNISASVKLPVNAQGQLQTVNVTGITVRRVAGTWNLTGGEIVVPNNDVYDLDNGNFGAARFKTERIILRQAGLYIQGSAEWDYPLPSNTGNLAKIRSKVSEIDFGNYVLSGGLFFEDNQSVALMSPMDFVVRYDGSSNFQVSGDNVTLNLTGHVQLPNGVATSSNSAMKVPFSAVTNPMYFVNPGMNPEANIILVSGSKVQLEPKKAVFDFSEASSTGPVANDPSWKGIYFNDFNVILPTDADGSHQLELTEALNIPVTEATSDSKFFAISNGGASGKFVARFDSVAPNNFYASFNTFPGKLRRFVFEMENGMPENSAIYGAVQVKFVSYTDLINSVLPISGNGFQTGYLEGSGLEGRQVVFNQGDAESEVKFVINQAQFDQGNSLKMNVDVQWPTNALTVTGLDDLKVWGDDGFGFGSKDGTHTLVSQVEGKLQAFPLVVSGLKAYKLNAAFKVDFIGRIVLPGGGGAPGGSEVSLQVDMKPAALTNNGAPTPTNTGNTNIRKVYIAPIKYELETSVLKVKGTLEWVTGDPKFGDKFEGKLEGSFKLPAPFGALVHVLVGSSKPNTPEECNYWYVRARVNGLDIPVGPTGLSMDGFDASAYYHMRRMNPTERQEAGIISAPKPPENIGQFKLNTTEPSDKKPSGKPMEAWGAEDGFDLKPDANSAFGFQAKVGMKDASSSAGDKAKLLVYAGFEMTFGTSGSVDYVAVLADLYFNADKVDPFKKNNGYAKGKIEYFPATSRFYGSVLGGAKFPADDTKLCAVGRIGFDFGGPGGWSLDVGTPPEPVQAAIGDCDSKTKMSAYLGLNKNRIRVGLGSSESFEWKSPELDLVVASVGIFAKASFELKLDAEVNYSPFALQGALTAKASAELGISWSTLVASGKFVIIGAGLGGELKFKLPDFCASGKLHGEITVLGHTEGFDIAARVDSQGLLLEDRPCF